MLAQMFLPAFGMGLGLAFGLAGLEGLAHRLQAVAHFARSGMVAGKMTTTGVVGYVAAHPIPEVIRGMELNTPRYEAMVRQALPRFLHRLALDFAGVKGSRLHRDAVSGEMSYRSFKLTRRA